MTVKETYDILLTFRDSFLSEEECQLPNKAKQALWAGRLPALDLSGHDTSLDTVIGTLAIAAESYAKDEIPGQRPISFALPKECRSILAEAWGTIENAKKSGDIHTKEVAEHLQLAIYTILPPQNNLRTPGTFRDINTSQR